MHLRNNKIILTWGDVHRLVRDLATRIKQIPTLNEATGIVSIPFGGYIPGAMLAYELKLPIRQSFREGYIAFDEIVDSGATYFEHKTAYPTIPLVCLLLNDANFPKNAVPPLHAQKVQKWVVFPWEVK